MTYVLSIGACNAIVNVTLVSAVAIQKEMDSHPIVPVSAPGVYAIENHPVF